MKQQDFEAANAARWEQFAAWLERSQGLPRRGKAAREAELEPTEVPARYRELCQHLALARDRQYSAELIERLSRLALAGHQRLYGAHGNTMGRVGQFLVRGFPAAVRAQLAYVTAACLLFFGPLIVLTGALQSHPDFAYVIIDPEHVEAFEEMYGEAAEDLGRRRDAGDDVIMFGYYIWKNVRIGFQTFAGGILFGLGAVLFLLFNGLYIGTVTGYLVYAGFAANFFSFTSGHSAFELSAIALCGAAGLRLGYGLVAPGRLKRADALRLAAREALPLVTGASCMLVLAAAIEAFRSPRTMVAAPVKYAVGGVLWLLTLGYFAFMGRARAA